MKAKLACLLFLLFGSVGQLWALGVKVAPASTTLVIKPGESQGGVFEVENPEDQIQKIQIQSEDWLAFRKGKRGVSTEDWVTFEKKEFVLKPKERITLHYQVHIDKDFRGEHVAQVFFSPSPLEEGKRGNVGLRIRSGVLLMAIAKGTVKVNAEIGNAFVREVSGPTRQGNFLHLEVKNMGNVHIKLNGSVKILDSKGEVILAQGLGNIPGILGGENRVYPIQIKSNLFKEGESYICEVEIFYGVNEAKGGVMYKTFDVSFEKGEAVFVEKKVDGKIDEVKEESKKDSGEVIISK
ncbi:MAG: hypothetical protein HYS07_00365 [Chlamydiae bacterium]|nr:hypothetical protein [Chlamydiota bacterium]MBI3278112.1 hypothetical protein [Chlamydiota bacterium]